MVEREEKLSVRLTNKGVEWDPSAREREGPIEKGLVRLRRERERWRGERQREREFTFSNNETKQTWFVVH